MSTTTRPDRSTPPNLTSYEEARAAYHVELGERFNPVIDIIDAWAAEAPDDLALVSLGPDGSTVAEHTVAEVARESRRAARALQALGIEKGDPIFIMLPRVPAWYFAMLGAIRIGAVVMPGTNQLTARDISYRIRAADAVAAIVDATGADKLDAVTEELPTLRAKIALNAGGRDGWTDFEGAMDAAGDG
jgi:acyl-coenzyme A synthetase/AMP-(fatty) acid ligase